MKRLAEFLKTTALGGLLVLVPVIVLYLLISEVLQIAVTLATPIADLFPKRVFEGINFPVLIAIILILVTCFIIGLILRSEAGRRIIEWIEKNVFGRLPVYDALKGLTKSFVGANEGIAFSPALLMTAEGERSPAYVVEEHGDGKLTVLVPWSPSAFAGTLKIVDRDRIEMVDTNLGDFSRVLSQWGFGLREVLEKNKKAK